jgi:glycosyltransferase involved in cell wall biosynthesis
MAVQSKKLEDRIRQLKLENNVTLLGKVNDVNEWLITCVIFVQQLIQEASGLVFIEARAPAKPVIAKRVGGIKEIISHEETDYLVAPMEEKKVTVVITPRDRYTLVIECIQSLYALPKTSKKTTR